ncbi:MAG: exodeoxyribonuclease VII large subunit [Clostridia bacterium]|nr:exodeoxyribonuclease VII large subunit [Clostridia bacterium]
MKIEPISVSELNKYMKEKVAEDEYLKSVFVRGEISNFKHHYTGHMYFTLKDENSLIKCIMFKSSTATLNFVPKDGMKVNVLGSVAVFERDGVYQIYVKAMQEDGVGDLYAKFNELKDKLEKEGLFDEEHKMKVPMMPKVIGVLTSNTGAVIRDIINVSTRRNPNVYIRLYPVPVQGPGAAEKIANAIYFMNEKKLADVLIIARGGGSIEDLWPFNEEIVARAIYNSEIPTISAVGHETDFTIADFVADLRAPTPSAAAELAVTDIFDLEDRIGLYKNRLQILLRKKLELLRLRYEKCMKARVFIEPDYIIKENYLKIDSIVKELESHINSKMKDYKLKTVEKITKLDAMSPLKTLARGYSVVEKNGKLVKSKSDLKKDDIINVRLNDGKIDAKIC